MSSSLLRDSQSWHPSGQGQLFTTVRARFMIFWTGKWQIIGHCRQRICLEAYRDQMPLIRRRLPCPRHRRRSACLNVGNILWNLTSVSYLGYLGFRFVVWASSSVSSSLDTRQSVFTSWDSENWIRNACSAAWMAAALSIPCMRICSRIWIGKSTQNPILSRSQGGVSSSTASKMVFPLKKRTALGKSFVFLTPSTYRILKNPWSKENHYLAK